MKLLIYVAIATLFLLSCIEKNDSDIICLIGKNLISVRNADTSFSVDNDIGFKNSFTTNNENLNLTDGES